MLFRGRRARDGQVVDRNAGRRFASQEPPEAIRTSRNSRTQALGLPKCEANSRFCSRGIQYSLRQVLNIVTSSSVCAGMTAMLVQEHRTSLVTRPILSRWNRCRLRTRIRSQIVLELEVVRLDESRIAHISGEMFGYRAVDVLAHIETAVDP